MSTLNERPAFSWFVFGLMASVTFVGILSELVPSGILPQMTEGLGIFEMQVGFIRAAVINESRSSSAPALAGMMSAPG